MVRSFRLSFDQLRMTLRTHTNWCPAIGGTKRLCKLNDESPDGFKLCAALNTAAQDPARSAWHMYLENAARKDLSAYEMGTMFSRWLADGIYASQVEIARATGKDKSTIGR